MISLTSSIASSCVAFLLKTLRMFSIFLLIVTVLCLLLSIAGKAQAHGDAWTLTSHSTDPGSPPR